MPSSPATHDSAAPRDSALLAPPGLDRAAWTSAASRLLAKTVAEFAYEEIVRPVPADVPGHGTEPPADPDGTSCAWTTGRYSASPPPGAPTAAGASHPARPPSTGGR